MSKTSKTTYQIPNSDLAIYGGPSASYKDGNTTYKLNENQQKAYEYAQKAFSDGLQGLNVFSPETVQNINNQVEAYKSRALEQLDSIYTPMLQNTRNDAAKRFGNLDNSVFLQNLDTVEKQRANTLSDLAQNIVSKQDELYNQELQNRYDFLSFLNNYQNQIHGDALGAAGIVNNLSNSRRQTSTSSDDFAKILSNAASIALRLI